MTGQAMIEEIAKVSEAKFFPDKTPYRGISVRHIGDIARHFGVRGRHIEIAALENNIIPERYVRNMKLLSIRDQIMLLKSEVSVIGAGGLGGAMSEMLARIGVGILNLTDGDCFENHNLNRQRFSREDLLGIPKAQAAALAIRDINSSAEVRVHPVFMNEHNAVVLIMNSDVVADCLDNMKTRFLAEAAAKAVGIPMVSAAIAGESGQITTIFPEDIGLKLIYGEPENLGDKGAEASLGCLPYTVNMMASLQCSEIVKILTKRGTLLRNKLLMADLKDNTVEVVRLCGG